MDLFRKKSAEPTEKPKKTEETKTENNPIAEQENTIIEEELTNVDTSEILNSLKQFTKLLPKLEEKKEYSKKRIHQIEDKISEVEDLIKKLEEKRDNLQDDIKHVVEEDAKIDEIRSIMQHIAT